MDSKLVVEQMSGRWQVKHPSMRPLARRASELASGFDRISFSWIPRLQNSHADRLANEAMDAAAGKQTVPRERPAQPAQLELVQPANNNSAWILSQAPATRFILVRHAVTEYSVASRIAGHSDLELTEAGMAQSHAVADRLAALGGIAALYSSPLRRTRQSAAQIGERLGLEVQLEDGLLETNYGDWDGYTFEQVARKWPAELQRWLSDPAALPPGGESQDAVSRRVRRARDRILARHAGQSVVLVSHVSPIKILVQLALAAPAVAVHRMYLAPASLSIIDYFDDGSVSLRCYNDSAHLSED